MVEAKLLRKKLKNGLIVDKWDLVTIIEKQQAEIDSLRKNLDVALMIANKPELTDEEIMDELVKVKHTWVATTSVWFEFEKEELKKAIKAILRKAQEKC